MDIKYIEYVDDGTVDPVKRVRRAFIIKDGTLYIQDKEDHRPMNIALNGEETFGGYFDSSNIVFFMHSTNHKDAPKELITEEAIMAVRSIMETAGDVAVWAGVIRGEIGELWPTKELIGYVRDKYVEIGR